MMDIFESDSNIEIHYQSSCENIRPQMLTGFFVGWPNPPSADEHLQVLRAADAVELALDAKANRVVGFCTALTDGLLTADITLLEVLPEYRNRGIGSKLVRRMLARFADLYAVNAVCDAEVQPFYARLGMMPSTSMILRRRDGQCDCTT